jgi:uncharacterized membrane protein
MKGKGTSTLVFTLLLALVLLAGAYFRFTGIDWGEQQYLHPDERFLVWVGTDISPVQDLGDYWNAAASSLNPHNRGHGFYVYGTLPLFIARYLVDWIFGHSGFAEMLAVGRPLSALADLLIVLLVYLIGKRVFDRRVGLLGAAFSALVVMQIQQSHFYTVDNFINLFTWLAIYFAVLIATHRPQAEEVGEQVSVEAETPPPPPAGGWLSRLIRHPFFWLSIGFGFALGCAVASKLSAYPAALLLPAAFGLYLWKLPSHQRERRLGAVIVFLGVGAFVSLLTFRVFQPYAFSGPGFFGLKPNPLWVANIRELRNQAAGDVDFPPALQWARRPLTFSGQNLTLWGLGLPLGLLVWSAIVWAGSRLLSPKWRREHEWHGAALLWGWTVLYFAWQSLAFNPTMRYQLPIYPGLVIFAAWAVVALYDLGRRAVQSRAESPVAGQEVETGGRRAGAAPKILAVTLGALVLLLTFGWAWAFTRIYNRPVTRVQATRWIYQNVPGPVNLKIEPQAGSDGEAAYNQPLPVPYDVAITPQRPFFTTFIANATGEVQEITLPHLVDQQLTAGLQGLNVSVLPGRVAGTEEPPAAPAQGAGGPLDELLDPVLPLAQAALGANVSLTTVDGSGPGLLLEFPAPASLARGQEYTLLLDGGAGERSGRLQLPATLTLRIQNPAGQLVTQPLPAAPAAGEPGGPLALPFISSEDGVLTGVFIGLLADPAAELPVKRLALTLIDPEGRQEARAELQGDLAPLPEDPRGGSYTLKLDRPLSVVKGNPYDLRLELVEGEGALVPRGSANANETTWDDGLPLRMDGYDGYGGIYRGDLVFEMYWDDSSTKLSRFLSILDQADYLYITSNRQWGTVPRVPERYPLSREYYRRLLGCPPERSVEWCYTVAQVGDFQGDLGFDLVQVFDSSPNLGPLEINDQFAEEAFTVYDHPKVFIFQKNEQYDPRRVAEILGAVDLSKVIHLTPKKADQHSGTLLQLPPERLEGQLEGGTWASLFDPASLVNRSQFLAAAAWYLSLLLLGLIVYPFLRLALPGLADRGYPLARPAGLLLLSYLVWLAGSFRIPVTRSTISLVLLFLAAAGLFLAYRQRHGLRREFRERRGYFLAVEGLFLAFFLLDLLIRLGNPDLWHPAHGGEKPMDFAYLNAILKSTTFPPYDPWYAGGYLNYYYYGFVLVGALVKWIGITPAVAYNLILPAVFAMIALGAFSLAWNLTRIRRQPSTSGLRQGAGEERSLAAANGRRPAAGEGRSYLIGLAAALGMALLGNLGTVRMLFRGFQAIAMPGALTEGANLLTRLVWAVRGFVAFLGGAKMPFYIGDWYWIPSRAIPAPGDVEPITEFPFFTVLYGDPHAHLFAMPVVLLVLGLTLGVLLGRARWGRGEESEGAAGAGEELPAPLEAERPVEAGIAAGGGGISAGPPRPGSPAALYERELQENALPESTSQESASHESVLYESERYNSLDREPVRGAVRPADNGGGGEEVIRAEVSVPVHRLDRFLGGALWFFLAALAIGALYPTNAWDYYPYLVLAALALGYAIWHGSRQSSGAGYPERYSQPLDSRGGVITRLQPWLLALGGVLLLVFLTRLLWLPFYEWFGLGYNKLALWKGTHTPISAYLMHWGLFLFVIVSWMAWETVKWMEATPAASLRKLRPHLWLVYYALAVLVAIIILLTFGSLLPFTAAQGLEVNIAWLALPLAVWAGLLLLRPGQPDSKRFVLFMVGTGLVETLFVEVIVLVGDIGRMNTVFKFYLQVWTFFVISAAAALGWLLPALRTWTPRWRRSWSAVLGLLVFSAALYPLMATRAKIENRMVPEAPHTLDGMAYMASARYAETFGEMDLGQDFRAIRWMQENIPGSPVIVEANTRALYHWGSRFSIYTGLPSVVGWEWHQQQQRALYPPNWVTDRIFEIENFYMTTDLEAAADFLRKYGVQYIVVGQQERGQYAGPGLEKFPAANGVLWREVYREADTVIYEVIQEELQALSQR